MASPRPSTTQRGRTASRRESSPSRLAPSPEEAAPGPPFTLAAGSNAMGQAGLGPHLTRNRTARFLPIVPFGGLRVVAACAGPRFSCALTGEGAVYAVGDDTFGTVGARDAASRHTAASDAIPWWSDAIPAEASLSLRRGLVRRRAWTEARRQRAASQGRVFDEDTSDWTDASASSKDEGPSGSAGLGEAPLRSRPIRLTGQQRWDGDAVLHQTLLGSAEALHAVVVRNVADAALAREHPLPRTFAWTPRRVPLPPGCSHPVAVAGGGRCVFVISDRAGNDDEYQRLTYQIEARREDLERERSALERQSRRERRRRGERNRRKEELRQRYEREGMSLPGLRREPTPRGRDGAGRAARTAEGEAASEEEALRERAREAVCEDDGEEADLFWLLHEIGSGPVPDVMEGVGDKRLARLRAQHRAVVKLEVKRMQRAAACNRVYGWGLNASGQIPVFFRHPSAPSGAEEGAAAQPKGSGGEDGGGEALRRHRNLLTPLVVPAPTRLAGLEGIRVMRLAVGGRHVLALGEGGSVWAWGEASRGQLGLGPDVAAARWSGPAQHDPRAAAAEPARGLTSVPAWQSGPSPGQKLEAGTEAICVRRPRLVRALVRAHATAVDVGAGHAHSAALVEVADHWGMTHWEARMWGANDRGQLGAGVGKRADAHSPQPVPFLRGKRLAGVACGDAHTLVVTEPAVEPRGSNATSTVLAFGANDSAQLGLGQDLLDRAVPCKVPLLSGSLGRGVYVASVAAGAAHSAAVTNCGDLYTWGSSMHGQSGHGHEVLQTYPRRVKALLQQDRRVHGVALGGAHTLVFGSVEERPRSPLRSPGSRKAEEETEAEAEVPGTFLGPQYNQQLCANIIPSRSSISVGLDLVFSSPRRQWSCVCKACADHCLRGETLEVRPLPSGSWTCQCGTSGLCDCAPPLSEASSEVTGSSDDSSIG